MRTTILALCLIASAALATPITMLSPGGPLPGDPGIGPYQLRVGLITESAMCFDDLDTVFQGETWQANVVSISQAAALTGASLLSLNAEVWLFTKITEPGVSALNETAIQQAAWGIMNPVAPSTTLSAAYEEAAVHVASLGLPGIDASKYAIVLPLAGNPQHVQSFLIDPPTSSTPEASTLAGVGAGLLFFSLIRKSVRW